MPVNVLNEKIIIELEIQCPSCDKVYDTKVELEGSGPVDPAFQFRCNSCGYVTQITRNPNGECITEEKLTGRGE